MRCSVGGIIAVGKRKRRLLIRVESRPLDLLADTHVTMAVFSD